MREFFIKIIAVLVGTYTLVDIWAGFISACLSSIIVLRTYRGINFWDEIKLKDVFIWLIGVFVAMRLSMWILPELGIDLADQGNNIDSVFVGSIAGSINVYLFMKNYVPLRNIFDRFFKI